MDVKAYLQRINYTGPTAPTLETLRGLHMAHLYSVPFENLDIHMGRPIVLEQNRLFDKVVGQRRGGFCYELNGVFAELLAALGFDVVQLAARAWDGSTYGIEFDHMVLLVQLDKPYLADVGFGEAFREPLRLVDGIEQQQRLGSYRVVREGDLWRYDQKDDSGEWQPQHIFSLTPYQLEDYKGGCEFHQTSPESPFTQKRMSSLATPDGRITLRDNRLIVTKNGIKEEYPITGEAEFQAALSKHFGMNLITTGG